MFDLMRLVPANKFGDAYELEKSYEETGAQVPVVIPARAHTVGVSICPEGDDFNGLLEMTYSPLNRVDAGDAKWYAVEAIHKVGIALSVKPCQAIRLNITSGHCKMEIYAS
jgi:hypothetical protein